MKMLPDRLCSCLTVACTLLATSLVQAAPIRWWPAQNFSGPGTNTASTAGYPAGSVPAGNRTIHNATADVCTYGTQVLGVNCSGQASAAWGYDLTINGQSFLGNWHWSSQYADNLPNQIAYLFGSGTAGQSYGVFHQDDFNRYDYPLNNARSIDNATGRISLTGLTAGRSYLVQFWVSDTRSLANARTEILSSDTSAQDVNTPTLHYNQGTEGTEGQFVIGSFVADGSGSQAVNFQPNAGGSAQMNLFQLRDLGVNPAPVVTVSVDNPELIWPSNVTTLRAAIIVFGLNAPTNQWTQLSGPAAATLATSAGTNTQVTFTAQGQYVFQHVLTSGTYAVTNSIAVKVWVPPPLVSLSVDNQTLVWPANATTLRAAITVFGTNAPTSQWSQISGPAAATLALPTSTNTGVTFPTLGQYAFRYLLTTGPYAVTNTTWVNLWSPGRPLVNAGSSRSAWLPNAVLSLRGSYTNTTTPNPTVAWSVIQGPGTVTFGSPNSLATTASFLVAGTYVLALKVSDGSYANSANLAVQVYDSNGSGNFGYDLATLTNNHTSDLGLHYDYTGFNWNRVTPPPPAYVHPRLFFDPDDLPDLRARLSSTTQVGPIVMSAIRGAAASKLTNPGAQWRQAYDDLVAGNFTTFNALGNQPSMVAMMANESFRILIDNDATAGAKMGAALATIASNKTSQMSGSDWRSGNAERVYHEFMAWCYDLVFNYMTPAQQAAVRQMLAAASAGQWSIGMDSLPALPANRSNWTLNNNFYLLMTALAIEGESGYDANALPRLAASFERFYKLGVFAEGMENEGMGKAMLYPESLIPLAKRGYMIGATQAAKNHIRQCWLNVMETTGYGFTFDEVLGSNSRLDQYATVPLIRFLCPNDPLMDFVQRNDYGRADWQYAGVLNYVNVDFIYAGSAQILRAISALDFATGLTWDQAVAQQVASNAPLSQAFGEKGLMVTRSDWTTNGARLLFRPQTVPGGHSVPDRNSFDFSALGRIWVPQLNGWFGQADPSSYDWSRIASVVRVDDSGPSTVPAAFVEFNDSPVFTYAAGDAKDSYSFAYSSSGADPAISYSWNQKRLFPSEQPFSNLPWGLLPDWYWSNYSPTRWASNRTMQRAFRTVALARGTSPYALISDDIQQDGNARSYRWRMLVASDLSSLSFSGSDAIVTAPGSDRSLLVRVLSASGTPTFASRSETQTNASSQASVQNVLDIDVSAISPDFRVLLFPYTNGTVLPATTWTNKLLTIQMNDGQTDRFFFATNADGRTRLQPYRVAGPTYVPPVSLIAKGSAWKYLDNGSNQGTNWSQPSFNDSTWAGGPAPLGYGEINVGQWPVTTNSYGPDANNKYITTYYRRSFFVTDPTRYRLLQGQLQRDDGTVLYLNGAEIFRSNMPTGAVNYLTLASASVGSADEAAFFPFVTNTAALRAGWNVLAAEIHQAATNSSDIIFDLELDAVTNALPQVSLLAPSPNTVLFGPPALAFSASALDLDGIVARVEFFANRVKVGEATSGLSFAFTWSNPPAGDWLLTAVATDDIGAKTASLGVPITIVGTPTTLLATGSLWKYLDTGANLGSGWRSNAFNDATWASGPAPLGYGEINVGGWPATTNSYGPDANTKYITTYYRRTFTSPDPTNYAQLLFRLQRDDGAVVYLNGAEIFRSNMPTGVVNYLTLAASGVGGIDEVTFFPTVVSPAFLRAGVNLLAVEIHQVLPTSSDIIFDLELKAYPPSALPRLSAAGNSGPLTLAWPGWATNCTLQFATNLAPPVTWSSVTNTPVPTNGQWVLPLFRATNAQQFYRLQTP